MDLNQLSSQVIKAAINVHNSMDIKAQSEVPVPVFYRGQKVVEEGLRLDLLKIRSSSS
jgi:hypothetical protein